MQAEQYDHALTTIEKQLKLLFPAVKAQEVDYSARKVLTPEEAVAHLLTMLPKMREFLAQGRLEKIDRWLGFAQGYIHALGFFSLNECRWMNMPRDEAFVEK